jgi:hypothetical protein
MRVEIDGADDRRIGEALIRLRRRDLCPVPLPMRRVRVRRRLLRPYRKSGHKEHKNERSLCSLWRHRRD